MSQLTQAIEKAGPEAKFQVLSKCLKTAKTNAKGVTTITFLTEVVATNDIVRPSPDTHVGFVVWIPRKHLPV